MMKQYLKMNYNSLANTSFTMTNIVFQRLINYWLISNPYNYSGLMREKESDVWARDESMIRRQHWMPKILDGYLDVKFKEVVENLVGDAFKDSNSRLQSMVDFDLGDYGYELV